MMPLIRTVIRNDASIGVKNKQHEDRARPIFRYTWFLPVSLLILLTACGEQAPYALALDSQLPGSLQDESAPVREAYRFALANPDELAKYPFEADQRALAECPHERG